MSLHLVAAGQSRAHLAHAGREDRVPLETPVVGWNRGRAFFGFGLLVEADGVDSSASGALAEIPRLSGAAFVVASAGGAAIVVLGPAPPVRRIAAAAVRKAQIASLGASRGAARARLRGRCGSVSGLRVGPAGGGGSGAALGGDRQRADVVGAERRRPGAGALSRAARGTARAGLVCFRCRPTGGVSTRRRPGSATVSWRLSFPVGAEGVVVRMPGECRGLHSFRTALPRLR